MTAADEATASHRPESRGAAADPHFSLIVGTYMRSTEMEPMLRSLLAQTDLGFELIVVDQNPDDRLVPLLSPLREAGVTVKHLRLARPGLSSARNVGLAHAQGAIVAFPDDDCWYEPHVIERARAFFADTPDADGLLARWVEYDPDRRREEGPLSVEAWRRFQGGTAVSFALFFRIGRVRAVGGFCEDLGVGRYFGAGEEDDLILRLLAAGCRIEHRSGIHIHHFHAAAPQLSARQLRRNRSYGRGTGAVLAKNRLPAWVIGRGLVGPLYRALRSPRPAQALVMEACTIWGRIEGVAGWWLHSRRRERQGPAGS